MLRRVATTFLLCFEAVFAVSTAAHAQAVDQRADATLLVDTLTIADAPFRLSSFIVPGSVSLWLNNTPVDSSNFVVDHRTGALQITEPLELLPGDTLVAEYRRFPFTFRDVYRSPSIIEVDADSGDAIEAVLSRNVPPQRGGVDPFGNVNLRRSGSITRGIITGNRRDVSVESGLRMQLSGEVAEGVTVQAMLTDENTPIQPEGVTRRLNEFDRVAIAVETPRGRADLGDFNLALQGSRFADFNRKLQGISLSGALPDTPGRVAGPGHITVAGATSRGIFQAHDIQPIDGVQGPYRLRGREGERFIIVIAGSEVVYLDGSRLERGETNDYVIDYQTGEITFTATRLITDDRRIQVEFQYTTIEFTRTVLGARAEMGFWQRDDGAARVRIGTTFLREADGRDFDAELGYTPADSLAVVEAGDGLAFRSGAEPVAFDPEAPFVQYVLREIDDGTGGIDTVYMALQQAPSPGETVFRVRFAEVGPGQGAYRRVGRSVNGLQYEYVGPGGGEYLPIRILPKPRQHRLVGFHGSADVTQQISVFGEWAQSLDDQNRLSDLDAHDDVGNAWLAGLRIAPLDLSIGGRALGSVSANASRQFTHAHFAAFSRTRPVEFARRWNLSARGVDPLAGARAGGDERVDEALITYAPTEQTTVTFEAGRIVLGSTFQASRRAGAIAVQERYLPDVTYRVEHIASADTLVGERGTWVRQLASIREPVLGGRLVPEVEVEHEGRRQRVLGTDSLASGSLAFLEVRPGIRWATERLRLGTSVELRSEDDWIAGELDDAARAWTWSSSIALEGSEHFSTEALLGYRVRRFTERFRMEAGRQDTESILLRWNGRQSAWTRALETNWFYEALSERTPTLQEIYVQVTPDYPEAQYVWEDLNGDGIVQVDEFIPELTPNEGTYARTYIPSDSLTSVVSVQTRFRIEVDPSRVTGANASGLARALSQVATRTVLELQDKNRSPRLADVYLLKPGTLLTSGLSLNGRARVQQELFLFRRNPRYGVDLSYSNLRALNELASGREERRFVNWRGEGRYRFSERVSARLLGQLDRNRLDSDAFATRRYDIHSWSLEPQGILVPQRGLEIRASIAYAQKEDRRDTRRAEIVRVPTEIRVMRASRLQATARFEWASISVEGDVSGIARYELTDGRGPGNSYLWNVGAQYRLNEYLRATLAYDGRAPEGAPVLHTVRLQMSAVF